MSNSILGSVPMRAVGVATFTNWLISLTWYMALGKQWASLAGVSSEWKFELSTFILGLFMNLLLALGLGVVFSHAKVRGALQGASWGLILAALFMIPAHSGKWLWQDKPLLFVIEAGAHTVAFLVSGMIIGALSVRAPENRSAL